MRTIEVFLARAAAYERRNQRQQAIADFRAVQGVDANNQTAIEGLRRLGQT